MKKKGKGLIGKVFYGTIGFNMPAENREVIVISGLISAGKSWLLERLVPNYPPETTALIQIDDVQQKYWGRFDGGVLTTTERVYRNELVRNEVKTALIVDGARTVFVEAVMLTRQLHQRPFREMVNSAEDYLQAIAKERGEPKPQVDLKVIMLYCDVDTIRQRMIDRTQGKSGLVNPDAVNIADFVNAARQYELPEPEVYRPMPINNSLGVGGLVLSEAFGFLESGTVNPAVYEQRMNESAQFLQEARALIT